ncbi:hypothetical protein [Komagataeibacter diospyri]|uniref:hypothetical protein n=1 Tax=Komagataeibacter diospyri TaxID=1932662 RepID=UPI003756465A
MNHVAKVRPSIVTEYRPAVPAIAALIDARREGMTILPCNVSPALASQARLQLEQALAAMRPASPQMVMGWLKKLAGMVANAPTDEDAVRAAVEAVMEVCGDLPSGVWSVTSRQAWCRQPAVNGRLPGTFWPRPAELYALLRPIADRIGREVDGCKAILAVADQKPEGHRVTPTEAERAAVMAKMDELRREREARAAEEARVREFGAYMPGNDATLRGWDLIRALETDLPKMTGEMRDFTFERIAVLKVAAEAADALLENAQNA